MSQPTTTAESARATTLRLCEDVVALLAEIHATLDAGRPVKGAVLAGAVQDLADVEAHAGRPA
jgi:hypothetical protein